VACPFIKVPDCFQTEISNIFGVLLPCLEPPPTKKKQNRKEYVSVARTAQLHKIPADVSSLALHLIHKNFYRPHYVECPLKLLQPL
jgi:hypothetical protein